MILRTCSFFILFSFVFNIVAQKNEDSRQKHNPGIFWYVHGWNYKKDRYLPKYDRLVLDITYNDFSGDFSPFSQGYNSIGINTNAIYDIPLNKKHTITFGTGLGMKFAHIEMRDKLKSEHGGVVNLIPKTVDDTYEKNKLISSNVFVPFELRFRSKGWQHVKFHLGAKLGFQTGLFSKMFFPDKNQNSKINYSDKANRFTYSVHARFGIRNYAFYASYNLNPLFKNKKSTNLNWLQFGISISLF